MRMTFLRPLAALAILLLISFGLTAPATAQVADVLSQQDTALYRAAFQAAELGDFVTAETKLRQVSDSSLVAEVRFIKLMHPSYTAHYDELVSWLTAYPDRPGAAKVYALALRRRPINEYPPRPVFLQEQEEAVSPTGGPVAGNNQNGRGRGARDAYYSGDVGRALNLAAASGERWIAGLAAYRLGQFEKAMTFFGLVARNPDEDSWVRAGAAFWAARAAEAAGSAGDVGPFLRLAASFPDTFYGMIAGRRLELMEDNLGNILDAALTITAVADAPDVATLMRADPRARRVIALNQLGRTVEAAQELRLGLSQARDDRARAAWTALALSINPRALAPGGIAPSLAFGGYQAPDLVPVGGFTLDRALVFAVVRQESRFNEMAMSRAGAVGLMQLMPDTAASTAGADYLRRDPTPLFDPPTNLQIGQTYLARLLERDTGFDILRALAAYNGGPGAVSRTVALLGAGADSLMVIESLPYQETRNYVERVMANYWIYRRQFGQPTPTLDALAGGSPSADIRLDRPSGAPMAGPPVAAAPPAPAASNVQVAQTPPPAAGPAPAANPLVQRPLYQQSLVETPPAR